MVVVTAPMRFAMPILFAGLLMGCQPVWVANGTPERPLPVAEADCAKEASEGYFGRGIDGFMNKRAWIDHCIAAYGYKQVARPS